MSPEIHPLVCGYLIRDHKITDLLSICRRQKLVGALENVRIGLCGADVVRVWILTRIYEGRAKFRTDELSGLNTGVPLSSHKDER